MSLFELLSYTDDEIDVITSAVCAWSTRNRIDIQSEPGREALQAAVALVSTGVKAPEEIGARLDEVCAPPAGPPSFARASQEQNDKTGHGGTFGTYPQRKC